MEGRPSHSVGSLKAPGGTGPSHPLCSAFTRHSSSEKALSCLLTVRSPCLAKDTAVHLLLIPAACHKDRSLSWVCCVPHIRGIFRLAFHLKEAQWDLGLCCHLRRSFFTTIKSQQDALAFCIWGNEQNRTLRSQSQNLAWVFGYLPVSNIWMEFIYIVSGEACTITQPFPASKDCASHQSVLMAR